ncbi:polysaccharide biosynthesis C-terminal domain-containing protein [Sulfitobacter sp. R18_1]|uniref:polysaccharide biosynthesis C-terminal domain-containing protein n=1 Tax=Sulfitobacter sp. R18_1 TaxID=2821104 RepID=UPI001ADBC611|nr:polysaccharide biosynthesis C-terminal domain-containing protein [Sulfitobacter sp. R18_1]MBO9428315.1 polysaccharide biosynthesis C-terminal domain-containing protein [Sulfitobacter sp. R18_1]
MSMLIGGAIYWYVGIEEAGKGTILAIGIQLIALVMISLRSAALQGLGASNFSHFVTFSVPPVLTGGGLLAFWLHGCPMTLNLALWANGCGLMLTTIILHWRRNCLMSDRSGVSRDKTYAAFLRRQSLPVAGTAAVGVINSSIDVVMLGALAGPVQAGYYSAVLKLAAFLSIVRVRLAVLISHKVPPLHQNKDYIGIQKTCRPVAAISSSIGALFLIVSLLWGHHILSALYGPAFADAAPVMSVIIFALTVSAASGMVGGVFIMTGDQIINFKVLLASAIVNAALNPVAIYYYGALGAAMTLVASTTFFFVTMSVIMRRKFGIDVSILSYFSNVKPAVI